MASPRESIKTIRDYEKFLNCRGFSRRESKILAAGWIRLEEEKHRALQCGVK